jgi:small subunit ribosomal protein S6e
MRNTTEGNRIRKLIRGNMITEEIYQLNCSLVEGSIPEKAASSNTSEIADVKK